MKVLVFGSSIIKYLKAHDRKKNHKIGDIDAQFYYRGFSGKSFEFFIDNAPAIDAVLTSYNIVPDYVVVHLGGNSISINSTRATLIASCTQFYDLLRARLNIINPKAMVIASPVLQRYVYDYNYDTPQPRQYNTLRNHINDRIRVLRCIDFMLRTTGPNNLDNKDSFSDGIHLTSKSNDLLLGEIIHKVGLAHGVIE